MWKEIMNTICTFAVVLSLFILGMILRDAWKYYRLNPDRVGVNDNRAENDATD